MTPADALQELAAMFLAAYEIHLKDYCFSCAKRVDSAHASEQQAA